MIETTSNVQPTPAILSKLIPGFGVALPWIVFCGAFIAVNHAADTQTLVTAAASGEPHALAHAHWLWLTPAAAAAAGIATGIPQKLRTRILTALVSFSVVTMLALAGPQFLLPLLLIPILIIAGHLSAFVRHSPSGRVPGLTASILTLIIAIAAYARQEALLAMINTVPDPDFQSYLIYAQTTRGWSTQLREPLYIWILQLTDKLGGTLDPVMVRLTSVATGLAATAALFQLCRRHLNLTVAIIAALFYSLAPYLTFTSGRGLRDDTIIFTAMLFISVAWSHLRGPVTWKSLTLLGFLGAACALLRISSFSFALVTIAAIGVYRSVVDTRPWALRARWLLPLLLTAGLMAPYLIHCKRTYGNSFFLVNYAARFFANEEFGGIRPDFPTRAELAVDGYAGPTITPGEYIFKYHSTSQIISRTWSGFVKTFFGTVFEIAFYLGRYPQYAGLLYILHFIGIGFLLFPRRIFLVLVILLFHAPMFFLASIPTFDPRLLILAMVFGYITVASAIGLSLEYAVHYLRESPETAQTPPAPLPAQAPRRSKRRKNMKPGVPHHP